MWVHGSCAQLTFSRSHETFFGTSSAFLPTTGSRPKTTSGFYSEQAELCLFILNLICCQYGVSLAYAVDQDGIKETSSWPPLTC